MNILEDFPVLIAQSGPLNNQRWVLDQPLVIGRETHCNIVIDDRQVSRLHARLTPSAGSVILEDLGSRNGTFHNGHQIENPLLLKDGDQIQISLVQTFVFFISDATMPLDIVEQPDGLRLDVRSRRVWVNNQLVVPPLSAMQFHVLQILFDRQNQVVSRQELIAAAWGDEQSVGVSDQALDALIRRLRERIYSLDPKHEYIVTVRGHGIRFDNPSSE